MELTEIIKALPKVICVPEVCSLELKIYDEDQYSIGYDNGFTDKYPKAYYCGDDAEEGFRYVYKQLKKYKLI